MSRNKRTAWDAQTEPPDTKIDHHRTDEDKQDEEVDLIVQPDARETVEGEDTDIKQ